MTPRGLGRLSILAILPMLLSAPLFPASSKDEFSYSDCLFGRPKSLSIFLARVDGSSRTVECNGADTSQLRQPFDFDWGDGERSAGFFPLKHLYRGKRTSFILRVTARYPDGSTDTAEARVAFVPVSLPAGQPPLPEGVRVVVPSRKPPLRAVRAPYSVPSTLTAFDDRAFQDYTRQVVEYMLTQAAAIQLDLANDDICRAGDRFEQVVLRDPKAGGMYSLWYTDPVCFGIGDGGLGPAGWSSFFHEMGHNVTLNSPAKYHWGFKQDGPANCIYSETLAQIFQHATARELLDDCQKHGIGPELAFDIALSVQGSMAIVRAAYDDYRKDGRRFSSWGEDKDVFDTFMTVAFKFFEHAENGRKGYRQPVKRLMAFLQRFDPEWEAGFSAKQNSPEAERFRATLMVAGLSHAFDMDLREEFGELRFPVDDEIFKTLRAPAGAQKGDGSQGRQPAGEGQ